MSIQVLGVAGSPRPYGNSAALLDEVLDVARNKGLDVEQVSLNDLYYKGCQACLECVEEDRCQQPDELQGVMARLLEAKVWVFAAPIYFDGVCGQMKLFFDRLYSLVNARTKLPGRRRAALLVTYDAPRDDFYDEVARRMAGHFHSFGDFEVVEVLALPMAGSSDPVHNRPEAVVQAKAIGENLFVGIEQPAEQAVLAH